MREGRGEGGGVSEGRGWMREERGWGEIVKGVR